MSTPTGIDADRVMADLRELAKRTSDERGAQRVAWTETWHEARAFLGELLDEIGASSELDEAGNLWARLGDEAAADAVAVGSHLDSVPDGGWLDGALGVMTAVGVLRAHAASGSRHRPLVLVDWADEEGSRFGFSLFGSTAFAGELDPGATSELRDAAGRTMREVLGECDVDIGLAPRCAARRAGLAAYLELHIEQGPVLEAEGVQLAVVEGCQGIERLRFTFTGQAAHAGTTPMAMRHDAGLAAARCALRIAELAGERGGVATTGELRLDPGIPTAVAGSAELACDLRHPDADSLAAMLRDARTAADESADAHGCRTEENPVFRIAPTTFDPALVSLTAEACDEATGQAFRLTSGALHDAASVSRVMPAAMMFCPSREGLSHTPKEDTAEEDLKVAIGAFGRLAGKVLAA